MFDVFGSVRGLLKFDTVCIDNNAFRLHYKVTVIVLVAFSLLVTARQYVGDPIDCIVDDVPLNIMDTYCWLYSTFTVANRVGARVGKDVVQPGVSPYVDGEDDVTYHSYYQWVCFVLFFQAAFFYLPRYMWKTWEGGRIEALMLDLNRPIVSEENKACHKKLLVDYLAANLHTHNVYAVRFFVCELLNLVNVVAQMVFMDYFLGGEFSTYGSDVLSFTELEPEDRVDPMAKVFPKVTKCTFHKYGPSGTIQKLDGLCVLPLNVVNEKIYVFLWFWFLFVAAFSCLNLAYRVAVLTMPVFRMMLLRVRLRFLASADELDDELETIINKCQIGDWFVLHQLSKNIDPLTFKEVVSDLAWKWDNEECKCICNELV